MNCNLHIFYLFGILVAFAYDDVSFNKIATQSHTWEGSNYLYRAGNAVDRNIATCMRARGIGTSAPDKTVWWKVDLGGVYSIYSVNILFKNYDGYEIRQRGRFAGFSLYVSNTGDIKGSSLCYKDGPQLLPLNFTTVCTKSGRFVIYYNERLDGVTYPTGYEVTNVNTDLCEVTVQGCKNASFYGINCDTPCPTNCRENTCHIQSGTCFTCKPGWSDVNCTSRCGEGWYGVNCSQQCVGHCKDRVTCNHVTGQCDGGCDTGWSGTFCDKECDDGTYGYNCVNKCSGHCFNGSKCNKQTGHCDRGCNPGYTTGNCSKVCPSGQYGINCRGRCSGHCINSEPCNHISGDCSSGCQDGFVGTNCNNSCTKGYFGTNCSRECSPNCKPDTCRHTDGSCTTCDAGWTGFYCTTACVQSFGENCRQPCSLHCYNNTCDTYNGRCLLGCKDGFSDILCDRGSMNQNSPCSIMPTIGLSVSLLVNLIFIVREIVLYRRSKSSEFDGNLCWKRSIYQETVVKTEESSTYQELDLSENAYQNTAIR